MPALKAKIKLRPDLPWEMEQSLIQKHGFVVFSRKKGEWLIVAKYKNSGMPTTAVHSDSLPEEIQNQLIARCNTIVNHFSEPERYLDTIRRRLTNISRTLPPLQQQYVLDWMERNCTENQ